MTRTRRAILTLACALLAVGALLAASALGTPQPVDAGPPSTLPAAGALDNTGFEDPYVQWDGTDDRRIADGWSLWYVTGGDWHRDPPRSEPNSQYVRQGSLAQLVNSDLFRTFDACLYQQISGATPGHYVRFSAWARVDSSLPPDLRATRVGIDPAGGTDPLAIRDDASLWDDHTASSGQWQQLSVSVHPAAETVTVYACARPAEPWDNNFFVRWDDASFSTSPPSHVYMPVIARSLFTTPPGSLLNPDVERSWGIYGDYQDWPAGVKVKVAPYWAPFWHHVENDPANKVPEYGYPEGRDFRVYSGGVSQQYGTSGGGSFDAGIYQVIEDVTPGATYAFSMWGHGWSSDLPPGEHDERTSDVREGLGFRVGIDPYGGEDDTSGDILWSAAGDPYDVWTHLVVTATAQSDRISVWAHTRPTAWWIRYNQIFWDAASLTRVAAP